MTALVIAFCAGSDRGRVAGALLTPDPPMLLWHDAAGVDIAAQHRPLLLLSVGPEGGAALARWVEQHGLEGVAGVGLVGVTAPWAERPRDMKPPFAIGSDGRRYAQSSGIFTYGGRIRSDVDPDRLPLRPLEPLRKVAARARVGEPCSECGGSGDVRTPGTYAASLSAHEYGDSRCGSCLADGRAFPLRLVVACSPDDGGCAPCGSTGAVDDGEAAGMAVAKDCDSCQGTGKVLSSKAVADELIGSATRADVTAINHGGPIQQTWGGITSIVYDDRALLSAHGIQAALKALVPQ